MDRFRRDITLIFFIDLFAPTNENGKNFVLGVLRVFFFFCLTSKIDS